MSNGVYIDRCFEGINMWDDRAIEFVAGLRTHLCEEEHKSFDGMAKYDNALMV